MESKQPWLEVLSPAGECRNVPLTRDRFSIGREGSQSDLQLGPDPNRFISRSHCYLERQQSGWWLTANGRNATLLRQKVELEEIHGKALLSDGSTFCLLGLLDENKTRLYWSLTLHDPEHTQSVRVTGEEPVALKYNRAQGKLWRLQGNQTEEIPLAAMEWKLIDYMLERNRQAYNVPVLCTADELLKAVYEDNKPLPPPDNPPDNLRQLIKRLRGKLEINPAEPKFLVNHRGQGYLLYTHPAG